VEYERQVCDSLGQEVPELGRLALAVGGDRTTRIEYPDTEWRRNVLVGRLDLQFYPVLVLLISLVVSRRDTKQVWS
jgi:hypothetical protein